MSVQLIKWLAVKFDEDGINYNEWPEDATDVTQSNYEVEIEGWRVPYVNWRGEQSSRNMSFDCEDDFKYIEEYDEGESCTRAEFFTFMEANPTYVSDVKGKRQDAVKRIAELNQIAYDAVLEASKVAASVDLPYYCAMPAGMPDLDPNSDWDSSRC
jgi:hypothetical protein